ncbi:hypothetical protein [Meiothermus granaticius]|uniref:Holin-X, holin superfamily III n=1 Tax=Meiothermus granaticius NBRC 107808 TaxID=1227551 RepID=A0A399F5P7_9DEIN|nr:hypothetical protein [Meiothermus granaticius]RIH91558.1 hypothetical protein Mgrana_02560 [Meiothermus granaticius NBRC 107808]GEM86943.1 hypothetical protein MGR01S_15680 [Meiothermus granaticius NBRC 107808]
MTALGEVIIGVAELLEAEVKQLEGRLKGLLLTLVLGLGAGVLALGGLGWLIAAGYLQLRAWLPPAGAAAIMGVLSLAVAGGVLWFAVRQK